MTTSKSIGHTGGLAEMDYLPNSNSSEELASILNDYYDGPPSPPPVIMETQPEQSLWFSRYLGQQVMCVGVVNEILWSWACDIYIYLL